MGRASSAAGGAAVPVPLILRDTPIQQLSNTVTPQVPLFPAKQTAPRCLLL